MIQFEINAWFQSKITVAVEAASNKANPIQSIDIFILFNLTYLESGILSM